MRPHRRREPLLHVLIIGTAADTDAMAAILAHLPDDAYGQVLVETDGAVPDFIRPLRVAVSGMAPRPGQPGGQAVVAAVQAWVSEWMPAQADPGRRVVVWAGDSIADRVAVDTVAVIPG